MEAKLRAAFEGLPPVKPTPARHDVFPGPKPGVYFIDKEDVNQSNVEIVGMGTDRHNPDVPAIAVMNEILGGGFASRLFQKVRTELGLAYEVGGGISASPTTTPAPSAPRPSPRAPPPSTPPRPPWLRSPASTPSPSPRRNSPAPKTTSSTPSSSATTPATRCSPSASASSSTAIPPTISKPTRPPSKR